MNQQELDELKRLCDEATPAPWNIRHDYDSLTIFKGTYDLDDFDNWSEDIFIDREKDFPFINAARTALPKLIAEVEGLNTDYQNLQKKVSYIRNTLEEISHATYHHDKAINLAWLQMSVDKALELIEDPKVVTMSDKDFEDSFKLATEEHAHMLDTLAPNDTYETFPPPTGTFRIDPELVKGEKPFFSVDEKYVAQWRTYCSCSKNQADGVICTCSRSKP